MTDSEKTTKIQLDKLNNFYLMGIKGVAMTSIAQILLDSNKKVSGCDVPDEFVTSKILNSLGIEIHHGFTHDLPVDADCVIFTSAHGGPKNPIVLQAEEHNLPTFSQAELLAHFFNQKKGVAVCGVGGKSTVSAMTAWILEDCDVQPSFSVGVGEILGMKRTGQWQAEGEFFIAEADEYVIDPSCCHNSEQMTPRFSFLKPNITICTNLLFDHPDVYHSIQHTKEVFLSFFLQIEQGGTLIYNADSQDLTDLIDQSQSHLQQRDIKVLSYGRNSGNYAQIIYVEIQNQTSQAQIIVDQKEYTLELKIPGEFNLHNAIAACLAAVQAGVPLSQALDSIKGFKGTQRRFEFKGEKGGVSYYDDYAHHPNEIEKTIAALEQWHPDQRRVIVFQPHTFSRTKQLFDDFVEALSTADEVILLDIFPSAREQYDSSINSDMLVAGVNQLKTTAKIMNLKNADNLLEYCQTKLSPGDVLMTMGAGDIYEIHELME